jgi:glucosamine--fructose-6-phosphate aminotransferase (isomerizing)
MPVQTKIASEFEHFKNIVKENTGIIAISQSGETADLLDALKIVKNKRPYVLSICNRQGSTLTRMSDDLLYTNCGPEIAVAATKSYTGQIAILSLLHHSLIGDLETGKKSIKMIADSLTGVINENSDKLQEITDKYINARDFYFIGRGAGYPTALEGALKLKEISYLHAEGMGGGEMKHGTLSLIENGVPCIVVAPKDKTYAEMISNAREINARGGDIIGVSSEKNDVFKYWLKTPDNPIAEIVPLQLLAYNSAVKRGYNPDKPRNLAKSVTVK